MAITGDFTGLSQLGRNISALARVPSKVAPLASASIKWEIELEFSRGRDPYGRPWAPLRPSTIARGRRPPPLTDTRKMRDGAEVKPLPGAGIAITFADSVPIVYHQNGTRYMARRAVLPTGAFPKRWSDALERATQTTIDNAMRGK